MLPQVPNECSDEYDKLTKQIHQSFLGNNNSSYSTILPLRKGITLSNGDWDTSCTVGYKTIISNYLNSRTTRKQLKENLEFS